jgi:choline dehydrogenase
MGHKSDPGAVTDYNFKVHGTQNLRIVDASVFPDIPGLFISVPIYMIAERAADVIEMEHEPGNNIRAS